MRDMHEADECEGRLVGYVAKILCNQAGFVKSVQEHTLTNLPALLRAKSRLLEILAHHLRGCRQRLLLGGGWEVIRHFAMNFSQQVRTWVCISRIL